MTEADQVCGFVRELLDDVIAKAHRTAHEKGTVKPCSFLLESLLEDRLCYDLSYTSSAETRPHIATLVFTTRRHGVCARIRLTQELLTHEKEVEGVTYVSSSDVVRLRARDAEAYIMGDPECHPAAFIEEVIWKTSTKD